MTIKILGCDDVSPELVKVWGYDDNLVFLEQDEDLLLYDYELIPSLLELAGDESCPKGEYAYSILCQFCREQITRGGRKGAEALKKVVENLPVQLEGRPRQWYEYVCRLLSYVYEPKKM
jgi:hypothetical protein